MCYHGVAACATAVPLNPDYTADEFEHYLGRLRPRVVVASRGDHPGVRTAAARLAIPVVDLVARARAPAGTYVLEGVPAAVAAPAQWARPDDTALILLTSGTTSRQKLVPLTHRQVLAFAFTVANGTPSAPPTAACT